MLNIPQNTTVILFGAISATSDPRKGFQFLQPALNTLKKIYGDKDIRLLIFGASASENMDFCYPAHYVGHLRDDLSLALLYSAADVCVFPSTMEAFGNTTLESLACGTPCIAFNNTGTADIIEHLATGYLAQHSDPDDLANGIKWILEDEKRWQVLSENARQRATNTYSNYTITKKYTALYQKKLRV